MILVDTSVGSKELQPLISKLGIDCSREKLEFADAYFEGNGPEGQVRIGVERKRIQDMLDCIDDGRFTGHQRIGMSEFYRFRFVIIEGYWKPDRKTGTLLEGHAKPDGTLYWSSDRPGGGKRVRYSKLRRYLFSMSLAGMVVMYSRDVAQTAFDITELYHYFRKPWRDHTAMLAMAEGYHLQNPWDSLASLPTLAKHPTLVREWAAKLPGIGVKLSEDAERVFKTPLKLATADEMDWLKIPGVGVPMAQKIVRSIITGRES